MDKNTLTTFIKQTFFSAPRAAMKLTLEYHRDRKFSSEFCLHIADTRQTC